MSDKEYTEYKTAEELIETNVRQINKISQIDRSTRANKGVISGVSTGFIDLDKLTDGFKGPQVIVVGSRPGMGKTSLCLNIINHMVLELKKTILIFSPEMKSEDISMRMLCSYARVDMQKFRDGFLGMQEESDLARAAIKLNSAPLYLDDTAGLSIDEIKSKSMALNSSNKLGLIFVDYLQLIRGYNDELNKEQQLTDVCMGLKELAKELDIPILVTSQLNRYVERDRRQPECTDLKDCGSIEEVADIVLLLSKKKDFDKEEEMASNIVLRDLIVAKQRNGPMGIVPLTFNKRLTQFENWRPHLREGAEEILDKGTTVGTH